MIIISVRARSLSNDISTDVVLSKVSTKQANPDINYNKLIYMLTLCSLKNNVKHKTTAVF